ncbi:uncharacterized protein LOC128340004 [Hemicordylus capensis]|uniref:uncharacterized protein LOC128340004 n=1 Tax=Hemicordylus capensis TaxID=884348 RepID=UPI0023023978|nr:uncharacterized protein LOC128340004 [Hemicordylus capensis]
MTVASAVGGTPVSTASGPKPLGEKGDTKAREGQRAQQPRLEKGPSPIKIPVLRRLLRDYPNRERAHYIEDGFVKGFRIPCQSRRVHSFARNLKSVRGMEHIVAKKIAKEVSLGRVLGPFDRLPLPTLRVSPLGVVPKKAPGEYRLIHHLSYPRGDSVNDGIPADLCSVRYTSFDEAVAMIRGCGPRALMAKCDIESAFRLLPVHPDDFDLLGFAFKGGFYIDRALPMGCSVSCAAFEAFSSMLEWALRRRAGLRSSAHSLDDFIFGGREGSGQCLHLLRSFRALCGDLGVPLAKDKTEGPTTKLTFLGIELDTVGQLSRLPGDKLSIMRELLRECREARKVTLRKLQLLVGHLNFACRVVAPGRPFLRRLCDAMVGCNRPHFLIRVSTAMREDMGLWLRFLESFNGVSFWRSSQLLEADFQVQSDAAGGLGFGLYLRGRWCAERWPGSWSERGITRDLTFLELFPIVVAVHIWAESFKDSVVRFWCDNLAVVQIINSQTSKSQRVMGLVRALVLTCLRHNTLFTAQHVPGVQNEVADALSRFQMQRFRKLAPGAAKEPEQGLSRLGRGRPGSAQESSYWAIPSFSGHASGRRAPTLEPSLVWGVGPLWSGLAGGACGGPSSCRCCTSSWKGILSRMSCCCILEATTWWTSLAFRSQDRLPRTWWSPSPGARGWWSSGLTSLSGESGGGR